ncbi:1-deoxy-D-xylulose-5-phosphate synthase [Aquiluna borgnonia]|uniref:1-deoxy-D-xylulose-5-phosphate synthase n=1 Tax=Aquiluna borgnonia TaxID=2499157 RepID=A0A7D4TU51_9MICO|nr:1-deoxy-D-xylulose-5-phosphate synthase [Aquiluna borgnonia]QKJ25235.1 1-deoxy-D-xylulose-5-phosphate synthase [Aquiluna borgnonia]
MSILEGISEPRDLDSLSVAQLQELCGDIREYLVESVSKTGGHLGPNLGVVEISVAIHRVFDSPNDAIVFDTGHQSYVHKLLTGRKDFSKLRQKDGIAGYPQRSESVHDIVESSHASSSLSWADGISRAFKATGQTSRHVVAVIGDGALTGGMAWEALNNITDDNDRNLVVIVNDNGRSYAPTIGGLARSLNAIRTESWYRKGYSLSRRIFSKFGPLGRLLFRAAHAAGQSVIVEASPNAMFPNLDLKYIGPIDGHNLQELETALRQAKDYGGPVIVHAVTQKGKGYDPAVSDAADQFHAVGKINPETGLPLSSGSGQSWTGVFSEEIVKIADANPRVVGITGAMLIPVGLDKFAEKHPGRVFDVGIAEQHAVTSAAGMAFGGLHPVVAIYSTFLNRAFDQVLMDVALHKAGVTFVLDRAGITGPDGASHHGVWDLSMLQVVPGMQLAAPRDGQRLKELLSEAIGVDDAPTAVRFPKGNIPSAIDAIVMTDDGVDILHQSPSKDVLLVSVGAFAHTAVQVAQLLAAQGIGTTVVDPRWILPIRSSLVDMAREHRLVVTLEDGVRVGGFGSRLRQELRAQGVDTGLNEVGVPAEFLEHAERDQILDRLGLNPRAIAIDIVAQVVGTKVPHAKPLDQTPFDSSIQESAQ